MQMVKMNNEKQTDAIMDKELSSYLLIPNPIQNDLLCLTQ